MKGIILLLALLNINIVIAQNLITNPGIDGYNTSVNCNDGCAEGPTNICSARISGWERYENHPQVNVDWENDTTSNSISFWREIAQGESVFNNMNGSTQVNKKYDLSFRMKAGPSGALGDVFVVLTNGLTSICTGTANPGGDTILTFIDFDSNANWQLIDTFFTATDTFSQILFTTVNYNAVRFSLYIDEATMEERIIPPSGLSEAKTHNISIFPNPFKDQTTISYFLKRDARPSIRIFDLLGNEVANLNNKDQKAGQHQLMWKPTNLPSGVYFYSIDINGNLNTGKLLYQK